MGFEFPMPEDPNPPTEPDTPPVEEPDPPVDPNSDDEEGE
jgi:hypothetical protein